METNRFQIEFFGGPEDGLRVPAVVFPGRTLLIPVGWSASGATNLTDSIPLAARRAQYRFAFSRRGVDARNRPVICLRYQFVAVQAKQRHSQPRGFAARACGRCSLGHAR